jgi:hypothetical protein
MVYHICPAMWETRDIGHDAPDHVEGSPYVGLDLALALRRRRFAVNYPQRMRAARELDAVIARLDRTLSAEEMRDLYDEAARLVAFWARQRAAQREAAR